MARFYHPYSLCWGNSCADRMEHAKKMILVEPRVLESMQQREPSWDATSKNLKEKDQSIKKILEEDQDVYDKANAYQQALWQFLNRFEQYKYRPLGRVEVRPLKLESSSSTKQEEEEERQTDPKETKEEKESRTAVEQDVIASVPKSMRSKAERLLHRLKSTPEVKWNDLGEFEYRGQVIKKSNLTDLVNDVLRKRKSARDPQGWETFAQVLQRINVPQDLVGNSVRWSYINKTREIPQTPRKIAFKRFAKKAPKEEEEEEEEAEEGEEAEEATVERFETPLNTTPTKWRKKEARSERKRQRGRKVGLLWETI